jgi:YHS domain-containing protein
MQVRIKVMTRFRCLQFVPVLLVVASLAGRPASAVADSEKTRVPAVNMVHGVAVKGYDPVAYFTLGRPTLGVDQYTYRWKGVTYRFASAENMKRFQAEPKKYLPQYGGYCAYAMSINRIADIDPSRWAIVDGKLYFNNNYLSYHLWSLDERGNIGSADRNWPLYPKKATGE